MVRLFGRVSAAACAAGGRAIGARRRRARRTASAQPQKDVRETLSDWGVQFNGTYIGETLGSVSGGIRTGPLPTGRLDWGTDDRP